MIVLCFFICYISLIAAFSSRHKPKINSHINAKPLNKYDTVIIGSGIGGLCAAAVLSKIYKQNVAVFESHYHPGGATHSFPIKSKQGNTYEFDSGPTILLGCSRKPYNPLRQVLNAVGAGDEIDWIQYVRHLVNIIYTFYLTYHCVIMIELLGCCR